MPRASTRLDSFNAIAEPKRRRMLDALVRGERPVSDLVRQLNWPQPMVSKHLRVLRSAGLVQERRVGRRRLYRLNGVALKPVYEWSASFERFWNESLDRLEEYVQKQQKNASPRG